MDAFQAVTQFSKMLKNTEKWLDAAAAHGTKKSFDVDTLVHARLAPDQFSFVRQIQSACDAAKVAAAYLSDQKPPSHPDTEKTIAELRTRLQTVTKYLDGFKATDFAGWEERKVAPPWMEGRWLHGKDCLTELATPNFYFHITTTYAILRENGVDLGKRDFIGHLTVHEK